MTRFCWRVLWTVVALGTVLRQLPSFWRASAHAHRNHYRPASSHTAKQIVDDAAKERYGS